MVVKVEMEISLIKVLVERFQYPEGGAEYALVVKHVGAIEHAIGILLIELEGGAQNGRGLLRPFR
jgi:hypothetical protein